MNIPSYWTALGEKDDNYSALRSVLKDLLWGSDHLIIILFNK